MFIAYEHNEQIGVGFLATSGFLSLAAVVFLILARKLSKTLAYSKTHLFAHFISLLLANILQATGTAMNVRWIKDGGVSTGMFCDIQGSLKQLGNVATALLTFTLSAHLFSLLFLRSNMSGRAFTFGMFCIWTGACAIVALGPIAIQDERGPYFGISGPWCWITESYPLERVFLEYFIEFLSAGLCFIIYTLILLRVRGNLIRVERKWLLRTVSKEDAWRLAIGRDLIDNSMFGVAKTMAWYPVAYVAVLIPITIARMSEFAGAKVPFAATILTSVIFNLTGFLNVFLLLIAQKHFPEESSIPRFSTKRKHVSVSLHSTGGLVPFTVESSEAAVEYEKLRAERLERMNSASSRASSSTSVSRSESVRTVDTITEQAPVAERSYIP